jgi:hypothetical protein
MEEGTVQSYLQARRELERREREVLRLVHTVQRAAGVLERWQCAEVTNVGLGFPKEVSILGRTIDGASWPSARDLAEALVAWHEAYEAALIAWNTLPPGAREPLPRPA